MAKILMVFVAVILLIVAAAGFILYTSEAEKNKILRAEVSKTAEESQDEIKRLKEIEAGRSAVTRGA